MIKVLAGVLVLLIADCTTFNYQYQEKQTQTFPTALYDSLSIETENGEVRAWYSNDGTGSVQVTRRVSGRDEADAKAHLSDITVTTTEDTIHRWLRVKAEMPSGVSRSYGADFAISLLDRYGCNFLTANGAINVSGVKGPLTLHTSNGAVSVEQGQGPVSIATSNGAISSLSHFGGLTAVTSNGEVNVDLTGLNNSDLVDLHTSNGAIVLSVPDSISASIEAATSNGRISVIGIAIVTDEFSGTYLKGKFGSGAATIKLATSNGDIAIMKR